METQKRRSQVFTNVKQNYMCIITYALTFVNTMGLGFPCDFDPVRIELLSTLLAGLNVYLHE